MDQPPLFDCVDMDGYEKQVVDCVASHFKGAAGPLVLIDCGANIGMMSVKFVSHILTITEVHAIEPAQRPYDFLKCNLATLPIPGYAYMSAVLDYVGRGRLVDAPHAPGDEHARFIEADGNGDIEVLRIDDLVFDRSASILIKIDVEGGEMAVIRGAADTLKHAPAFGIVLEAHPKQVKRTSIDTVDIIRQIAGIRPVSYHVVERPDASLDLYTPFFSQFDQSKVFNVFVHSV